MSTSGASGAISETLHASWSPGWPRIVIARVERPVQARAERARELRGDRSQRRATVGLARAVERPAAAERTEKIVEAKRRGSRDGVAGDGRAARRLHGERLEVRADRQRSDRDVGRRIAGDHGRHDERRILQRGQEVDVVAGILQVRTVARRAANVRAGGDGRDRWIAGVREQRASKEVVAAGLRIGEREQRVASRRTIIGGRHDHHIEHGVRAQEARVVGARSVERALHRLERRAERAARSADRCDAGQRAVERAAVIDDAAAAARDIADERPARRRATRGARGAVERAIVGGVGARAGGRVHGGAEVDRRVDHADVQVRAPRRQRVERGHEVVKARGEDRLLAGRGGGVIDHEQQIDVGLDRDLGRDRARR